MLYALYVRSHIKLNSTLKQHDDIVCKKKKKFVVCNLQMLALMIEIV